jgi:hypothetical protein
VNVSGNDKPKPGPIIANSVLAKGLEFWNELSEEIQNCPSRELLKVQLKRFYLNKYIEKVSCNNENCID